MLEHFKQIIANQYEAAFCMLAACVDRCPEENWNEPVANHKFCQTAFHTLIFADLYLGLNVDSVRDQAFHVDNASLFGDYEEFEDRVPQAIYSKTQIGNYLAHCRNKMAIVVSEETAESLRAESGFEWLEFSRAELHIYNIRHIHHHAAQLSLRLRIDADVKISWVGSAWHDL